MKSLLRATLLATTTAFVVDAGVMPARAVIPVIDATANSSLVTQISHQITMISQLAEQVSSLANLVSLATIAGTTLGDTVSPELGALFTDLQQSYAASNRAYGSLMSVPAKVDRELKLFEPPPGGWESMSFNELVTRAQQLRKLTAGTNAAVVSRQADLIERRAEIAQQAARANGMADRSVSALSATQAVAQQMRVTGAILTSIEETNSDIAASIALEADQRESGRKIAEAFQIKDSEAMRKMIEAGAGTPSINPLYWGK